MASVRVNSVAQHQYQQQNQQIMAQIGDISQATSTAELTKMIRKVSDALDSAMHAPNTDYFAPHLESLRNDCLELFRRLLVRNPYSSHRKDIASKMWFRAIYPSIEQYRANIKQFEGMLHAAVNASTSPSSSSSSTALSMLAAAHPKDTGDAAKLETVTIRRELSKWRARFQTFLQASAGILLRLVAELAEVHALVAVGALDVLKDCALDTRTLAAHAYGFEFVDCLHSELHPELSSVQRATLAIISKLLTHLGDLSRYRTLYTSKKQQQQQRHQRQESRAATNESRVQAQSSSTADEVWWAAKNFYRGAIKLAPHRGQPHNQLAVIFGYERNSLDGIFHYYRALTAQYNFLPSEANLRTILDNAIRAIDAPDEKQKQKQQLDKRSLRPRASTRDIASISDANSGYVYYDTRIYARFTHLRYLFAFNLPTSSEVAALHAEDAANQPVVERTPISKEIEDQIVAEISLACDKFVHGAKSGLIDERQAMLAQSIHLFEQQQLSCLNANDKETQLHDPAMTRLSAVLTMRVAEHICFGINRSIADAMSSQKGGGNNSGSSAARGAIKSPSDLLSKPSRRTIPLLVQTLIWIVSACVRVVKDSASRDYFAANGGAPITELRSQLFMAIRDCGLLANMGKLRAAMEQAHSKISRRSPLTSPVSWSDVLDSMDGLAQAIWDPSVASNGAAAQRAYESELLSGWQLPDGTVWGKLPSTEQTAQPKQPLHQVIDLSEEAQLLALWKQLYLLLTILLKALPSVLEIVDREEKARRTVKHQKKQTGNQEQREVSKQQTKPSSSQEQAIINESTYDEEEEGDDEDNDGVDNENETICFQGRPLQQQSQMSVGGGIRNSDNNVLPSASPQQLSSAAANVVSKTTENPADKLSPDSQLSVPPTPQLAQQSKRGYGGSLASSNASEQLLAQLWQAAAQHGQGALREQGPDSTESAMRMIERMELTKDARNISAAISGSTSVAAATSIASGISTGEQPLLPPPSAGIGPNEAISSEMPVYRFQQNRTNGAGGTRLQGTAIAAATAIPSAPANGGSKSGSSSDITSQLSSNLGQQQQQQQQQHAMAYALGSRSPDDVYKIRQQSSASSIVYSPQLLPLSVVGSNSYNYTANQPAIDAWQQYQVEHQRKLQLQQQLEQQQRLQQQLQQQLLGQQLARFQGSLGNSSQQQSLPISVADQLDITTASVLNMAMSTPNEARASDLSSVYGLYGNFSSGSNRGAMLGSTPILPTSASNTGNMSAVSPGYQYGNYQQQQQYQQQQSQNQTVLPPIAQSVSYPHPLGSAMPGATNSNMLSPAYPWGSPMMAAAAMAGTPSANPNATLPSNNNSSYNPNNNINISSLVGYLSPMLDQKNLPQQYSHHHQQQQQQYQQYPIAGPSHAFGHR
ncbi:hypothetical protein GGI25_003978 [Coemansia spiralis]|uniref:Protein SMG7 n=2 Tax=Coemansia TaxID=4863 RepID=A0A9W8KXU9_9FUNG|nr:hypothetical protein EDC05_003854 [Coemansia umbellata]KAJ2675470.1 hypothetical protein GGI25_003978 [Coemansia spiralis]